MTYLEKHYNEIFKKYSTEELLKDIHSYQFGEGNLNKILSHFLKKIFINRLEKNRILHLGKLYQMKN